MSAISLMRCEERKIGPALGGEVAHELAHPQHALGVEPVDRLVEDQRRRVAEQGGGDAEPLAHAEREAADALAGDGLEAGELDDLATRLAPMPCVAAIARRWL